ncbi:NADH:flavin oxidoreductase/NADH oxidase [Cylindrobasidium torrendii FP15055 ss-10]|uniref:NADH:flavin oxidoreductase/NADH oxidase n=1 Tax=Cylindrobasidium torrendii FP15055 ss-10 TaxID=1314674 RepID=A0A0D7BCD7_9AGAR|nr:NADH:flavin oxidoreductase/NADH oxidase [Cylindrobasidium torrendii FP15055 ss-10]
MSSSSSKLFEPITVGKLNLQHRIVLAPLTRFKSGKEDHVPNVPRMSEYYSQRGSAPGTLLITEATFIAPQAGGYFHVPGIWSPEQIAAWKKITDAVHARGSHIYMQLWALGRAAAAPGVPASDVRLVSASDIPLHDGRPEKPSPLTKDEIKEYVQLYATAAHNAVFGAGFDGVEVHGANGYLIDQFTQDVSNKRTDEYSGSIKNRARFALEVVKAVVDTVGADRTAIRLSPWSPFQDMKMADPKPTFSYLVGQLAQRHPTLAYLHVVEPRIDGNDDVEAQQHESNDFIRQIWAPRPYVTAGAYVRENAFEAASRPGELVAFGRYFISNPDLVRRLKENIPLTKYDRSTFYVPGDFSGKGYTDFSFAP